MSATQLVGSCRGEVLYLVLPFMIAMVWIRRVAGFGLWKHQTLTSHYHKETVTFWNVITTKHANKHQPQLVTSNAWVFITYFQYWTDENSFSLNIFRYICLWLVEGLTTMATGIRAQPSCCVRWPAPLLLDPILLSDGNVKIFLGLIYYHVTRHRF